MIAGPLDLSDVRPASTTVIASCVAQLIARRDQIRAAVVVADVRALISVGDAIEVALEHAEGTALRVLLPYSKRRFGRGIQYGALRAQNGAIRVWPPI